MDTIKSGSGTRSPAKDAIDKAEHNPFTAVRDARIVVLAMPVSQVRETLEFIAPDLQENTVVPRYFACKIECGEVGEGITTRRAILWDWP
ncbi:MAG: prephenate dehydrogenase/arogenate dehydrogenase family protein [Anaerolineales bacterium]|nr:prephenate dehydrogenase/arogenate dehydrogenase family protein [Anaerolineales bacterium]